jgi:hypothetical protein
MAPTENDVDAEVKAVVFNCTLNFPSLVAFSHLSLQEFEVAESDFNEARNTVERYLEEICTFAKPPEEQIPQVISLPDETTACNSGGGEAELVDGQRKRKALQRYSPPEKQRNQISRRNQISSKKNQRQCVQVKKSIRLDPVSTGKKSNSEVLQTVEALKIEVQQLKNENDELKAELANLKLTADKETVPFQQQVVSPMLHAPMGTTWGRAQESEAFKTMRLMAAVQFMNSVNGFFSR